MGKKKKEDTEEKGTGERQTTEVENAQNIIEHLHRYLLAKRYCKGKTVLDIACGEGYGTNILAGDAKQVTGVDIDQKVIDHASAKYKSANIAFRKGNAVEIPVEDHSMDLVVSFETLEHLEAQDEMLGEIKRVMKPTGNLIISTPDKKYYSDQTGFINPFHAKELYGQQFRELLEKHFSHVQMFSQFAAGVSVIYPYEDPSTPDHWYAEGDLDKQRIREDIPAKYLIAIAGGEGKSHTGFSIFNGKSIEERINGKELESLLHSRTYRLGKKLTDPYRWIKRLFR
jgi:ubiquinone/menaquinone biosynthesis C-methylase UbiE